MTTQGADPFAELNEDKGPRGPQGPRPFAVGFDKTAGESLVYGGVILGGLLVLISFAMTEPLMALAALVPLAVAFWHYPMIDRRHPQLGANADGLFVERIGFINWVEIAKFTLQHTAVRNIQLTRLEVSLHHPLQAAVSKRQVFPFWKSVMMRNWRLRRQADGSEKLIIQLHTLTGDPDQILDRLRAFRNV